MRINTIKLNIGGSYNISKNSQSFGLTKPIFQDNVDTVSFKGNKVAVPDFERFITFLVPIYEDLKQATDKHLQATNQQMGKDEMKNFLKKADLSDFKIMGVGTNSICYKIPSSDGETYGVRFFRPDAMNYGNDSAYEKEVFALKKVKEANIEDAQELIDVIEKDGKHYIITNLAKGKPLNAQEGRILNSNQAQDVVKKLTRLDKSGFMQYDAQLENIFFSGDKAELIDFGGFSISVQDKTTLEMLKSLGVSMDYDSFYPDFGRLKEGDIKRLNLEESLKKTKPYLGFSDIDTTYISRNSNPYFSAFSNISNFEYRSLFYHLFDTTKAKGTDTANQVLINYLKAKGSEHHKPMACFFQELNIDEVSNACQIDKEAIAQRIKNATSYEKMLANLLSQETLEENVLKTELAKIQIRWVAEEQKSAVQTQFETLVSMIQGFKDKDTGALKQYYDNSLSFFEKLKAGIYRIPEGAKRAQLEPEFNLVEKLFVKTVQTAKDTLETAKDTVKTEPAAVVKQGSKNGGKIAAAIIGIGAVIGSVFAYFKYRKNKQNQNMENNNALRNMQQLQANKTDQNTQLIQTSAKPINSANTAPINPFSMQDFLVSVKQ